MRRRTARRPGLFVVLSICFPILSPGHFSGKAIGQVQAEGRPEFYALRVGFEKNVRDAEEALGKPDGRYAEILPGGQLVVFMEDKLYPFTTFDSGSIVTKGEAEYGLEGWFPTQDAEGKQTFSWLPLSIGSSPGGFRLAPIEPFSGTAGVDMIRIANSGTRSIFVDAVIGYGSPEE